VREILESIGRLHPALVHFPVALVLTAAAAEALYMARREQRYGDAARFMIAAAAWLSVPSAVAGFAAAAGRTLDPAVEGAFSIHRVAGTALPILVFLVYGLGEGSRRSGQVWEQILYRLLLLAAAVCVVVAAYCGGLLQHGEVHEETGVGVARVFGLTPERIIWY
jgi:uncharacterized membrane protein